MDENKDLKLLRFKGADLGLREIAPNKFEIINTAFFDHLAYPIKKVERDLPSPDQQQRPRTGKGPNRSRVYPEALINQLLLKPSMSPLKKGEQPKHIIKSFSAVVTIEIADEACILIKSLRQFHDQPILLLCDNETREHIAGENFKNIDYITTANTEDLEKAKETVGSKFNNLDTFHRIECIYKKMECMEQAMEKYGNTFFLDADIVVVDDLQENFEHDIVLSPHYHEPNKSHMSAYCGIFNAGYIFCANKELPQLWRKLYAKRSSFYEQEGMNYIPEYHDVDFFSKGHNMGFWRDMSGSVKEPIEIHIAKRGANKIKSFHVHMLNCIDFKNNYLVEQKNAEMRKIVFGFLRQGHKKIYNYIYSKMKRKMKTVFVHFGKCAGVYVNKYLRSNVLSDALEINPWNKSPLWRSIYGKDLLRDWTDTELLQIARGDFHMQKENQLQWCHNHHINWKINTIKEFKKNNWFTFTFLRNPKEIICSLYYYSRRVCKEKGEERNPLRGAIFRISGGTDPFAVKLDTFVNFMIDDTGARNLWILPDYIDELDYAAEFNDKNFRSFLREHYSHQYAPEKKENTSENKGFEHYCKLGEISQKTKDKIESDLDYKKYFDYLDKV